MNNYRTVRQVIKKLQEPPFNFKLYQDIDTILETVKNSNAGELLTVGERSIINISRHTGIDDKLYLKMNLSYDNETIFFSIPFIRFWSNGIEIKYTQENIIGRAIEKSLENVTMKYKFIDIMNKDFGKGIVQYMDYAIKNRIFEITNPSNGDDIRWFRLNTLKRISPSSIKLSHLIE